MKYNATSIQQHQAARLLTQHYRITRENILGDGVKLCQRAKAHHSPTPEKALIAVEKKTVTRKVGKQLTTEIVNVARMHDVAHCGNAHLCSFCSGLKASHIRQWIEHVFRPALTQHGLFYGLMTLTAHHKRESSWTEFVANFYRALEAFGKTMQRDMKVIGSLGRMRAMESPVGSNGLHLHIHDLFTYAPGADIDALAAVALTKWKAALRKFGLHCSKRGVDIKKYGCFDPLYIAKELAAHDSKKESKSDLVTLFKLLDNSARGNKQAGQDWLRAAKAIQGRDRWNVGQLAQKLGIPSPSDWKHSELAPTTDAAPIQLIEYPQSHHMLATSPNSERAGLAFVLRAARNEAARPGSVQRMALRMCDETIKADVALIKQKHAYKLAQSITPNTSPEDKQKAAGKHFSHCTFAIAEYCAKTYSYMFPAAMSVPVPMSAPTPVLAPIATIQTIAAGLELDFT